MSMKHKEEESSLKAQAAPLTQFSFRQFLRNSFLVSLPHLTLLLIFSLYVLFGAAILKEIESDRPLANETSNTNHPIESEQIDETTKRQNLNSRVNEYTKSLSQFYDDDFNQFKEYNEKLTLSYNKFLLRFNKIVNIKEEMKSAKSKEENLNDKNETESMKILSSFYNKKKNKMNVTEMFKAIAQNLIEFRRDLKENLGNQVRNLFNEYNAEQNELKSEFKNLIKSRVVVFEKNVKEIQKILGEIRLEKHEYNTKTSSINLNKKLDMKTSIYFMGSLLTTIGYGDVKPYTILGKLFIMFYVILGIPLTLILLSDLGSVFTRTCKFLYAFLIIFYNDGYYERLLQLINERRKNLFTGSQKETSKRKLKRSNSIDQSEDNLINNEYDEKENKSPKEPSLFFSLCELAAECYEQNDDAFDLSLGFLFTILFSYLTFGAIVNSRVADWSLLNGYYFSLITFTRIGLGDLTLDNTKFILLSSLYTLFGIACFDLTIQNLREKIRLILISNGHHIVTETVKFMNQFGYEWSIENVNFNFGVNSQVSKAITNDVKSIEKITSTKRSTKAIDTNKLNILKEVKKCDKQTQITTLLYTKFRLEKATSPQTGHVEKSTASVKPNLCHAKESNSLSNQKLDTTVESTQKPVTEEEFLNSFSTIETKIVKVDEKNSKDDSENITNVTFKLNPIKEDKHANEIESTIEKDKAKPVVIPNPENDINTNITLRRNRFSNNTTPTSNSFQARTNSSRFK